MTDRAGFVALGLRCATWLVVVSLGLPSAAQTSGRYSLEGLLKEGRQAYQSGDHLGAIEKFDQYLRAKPDDVDVKVLYGWSLYRLGRYDDAAKYFDEVLAAAPRYNDARVGLAYVTLQKGDPAAASELFADAIRRQPDNVDALRGAVIAARRDPKNEAMHPLAISALTKLRSLEPDNRQHVLDLLWLGGQQEERIRPPVRAFRPPRVQTRAGLDYLEILGGGTYVPFFIKGFNLGAALPGKFATEFPTDVETYRRWLSIMADFGANSIRLYTLLPPEFYRALDQHNREAGSKIWLIQGVWTELPPRHDFSEPVYLEEFHAEIARVIDAVHGNLILAPRHGHASGIYEVDVSSSLLAYIIGREWEPFAVTDYNAMRPNETSFQGKWFEVENARAMECWVAKSCDFAAEYEASRYNTLHALTFANWPTLDPLHHPTESTRKEEDAWRRQLGIEYPEKLLESPWEDDRETLDSTLIRPTKAMGAGLFAAYHIYPNYPDFMNLEPGLDEAKDADGPNRYLGYLLHLKKAHGRQPVVVAEFGMSTSRGIAHVNPMGWHHGGIDERDQGRIVSRMFWNIHDAKYAGGIVFAFMDEWFKGTWSVAEYEIPAERRRFWFNAESPEQSYGILAARPGTGGLLVDGRKTEWSGRPALMSGGTVGSGWSGLRALHAWADEGFVYLLIDTAGRGEIDWTQVRYRIGIDTYDENRGERALEAGGAQVFGTAVEFLVVLDGPDASEIKVTPPYDAYTARARVGDWVFSPTEPTGKWTSMRMEANRERFGRDGTRYLPEYYDRGKLRFGSLDPASPEFTTLTDVSVGRDGVIEMRIPWGLLNVVDPSTRNVLHRHKGDQSVVTRGFRFHVLALNAGGTIMSRLPEAGAEAPVYAWPMWTRPTWRHELKRGSATLKETMRQLPDYVRIGE